MAAAISRADATHGKRLVHDQQVAGLGHAFGNRFHIQRDDRPQIDDLARNSFAGEQFGRLDGTMDRRAAGDDGQIVPARTMLATPKGTKYSPLGTGPLVAKRALGSSINTGSLQRKAVFISPLASAGFEGMTTIKPGQ